jgi:hypothetical protein
VILLYVTKGVAVDGDAEDEVMIVKQVGKVAALRKLIDEDKSDFHKTFISHCSMVRTNMASPWKAVCEWTSDAFIFHFRFVRHIPVGLLTVSLHPSTLTLTDLIPPTSLSSFTTVSSPTTRNSRPSWRRMAMCSSPKLTLNVLLSSPSTSMTEKRPTVT